jgi:hypothetical protein
VSVVVPTRNRPARVQETVTLLARQSLPASEYEIVVVDDGSTPPLSPIALDGPPIRLVRLDGGGRSGARNAGAEAASGTLLVFVDDDIGVEPTFLRAHVRAQEEWPGALAVGAIRLPSEALARPLPRFRQRLEQTGLPRERGLTTLAHSCTAANLSLPCIRFRELGGFDRTLASGEDQDLALRHTTRGGAMAFLPEAVGIHNDSALDIRGYCRRVEAGSEEQVGFLRRHPEDPQAVDRNRVNGPLRLGREPLSLSARKLVKSALSLPPALALALAGTAALEAAAPESDLLEGAYRLLLGIHIQRGYRRGLRAEAARTHSPHAEARA